VVSKHGSPLALDGWCVGYTFMSAAYVLLILVVHVLVAMFMVLIMVVVMFPFEG